MISLLQIDPGQLLMEVKAAIKKGYLHTKFDKEALEEVKKIRVAEEFFGKRKETLREYDDLNVLATKVEIPDCPKAAIRATFPLFERLLIVDGRRRAFDEIDRVPNNLLEETIEAVEQSLKDSMDPSEIEVLCSISPFESYELYRTKLLIGLIKKYSLDSINARAPNEEVDTVVNGCFLSNRVYLDRCLKSVLPLIGSSKLTNILKNKEEQDAQKSLLIDRIAQSRLPDKGNILTSVNIITEFKRCFYFEDAQRHNEIDFYGDYTMRVAMAESLFKLGVIFDKRPFEHSQQKLYDEAKRCFIGALK